MPPYGIRERDLQREICSYVIVQNFSVTKDMDEMRKKYTKDMNLVINELKTISSEGKPFWLLQLNVKG